MSQHPGQRRVGALRVSVVLTLGLLSMGLVGCSSSSDSAKVAPENVTSPSGVDASSSSIRLVTADDAEKLATDPSISVIDVRTPAEFAEGHLAGARLMDFRSAEFPQQLGTLDPNGRYLIYCRSGNRSGEAVGLMKELGFTDVADLDGGIVAWTGAGKPVSNQ
jgi:phage shock protein E